MDVTTLMKGNVETCQRKLNKIANEVRFCVQKGIGYVFMEDSHKKILFPILEGLRIPFKDATPNGVIIGDDMDKVIEEYESI